MKIGGVVAATVLPFDDDGQPDIGVYQRFVDELVSAGVGGLAVNADSGEGMSLWPDERRTVMRAASDVTAGRVPLVAGLIASFTDQACRLGEEAAADGADLLMVFPNVHLRGRPLDLEVPLGYLEAIHRASGLPLVAFQLQDALGGVEYDEDAVRAIVELPYVVAIKESTFDAHKFRATMDLVRTVAPGVSFLSGNDNFIYESFVLGADGALVGAGSIATHEQVAMFEAVRAGRWDEAAELNERLEPLMRVLFRPPIRDYRARIKEGLVGLQAFPNASVRRPLLEVDDDERSVILAAVRAAALVSV